MMTTELETGDEKKVCCMLDSHSCIHPFTHSVTHSPILTDLDDHCSM